MAKAPKMQWYNISAPRVIDPCRLLCHCEEVLARVAATVVSKLFIEL
jgi:hypothetical protein